MKTIHPVIFQEDGFPRLSLTKDLRNIYPLLQGRNISHLQKRVEIGGISPDKVIEIVKLTVQMIKSGQRNYLNEEEESLVISSSDIEGGHGLFFDCRGVSNKLKKIVKYIKYRCSYNNILEK